MVDLSFHAPFGDSLPCSVMYPRHRLWYPYVATRPYSTSFLLSEPLPLPRGYPGTSLKFNNIVPSLLLFVSFSDLLGPNTCSLSKFSCTTRTYISYSILLLPDTDGLRDQNYSVKCTEILQPPNFVTPLTSYSSLMYLELSSGHFFKSIVHYFR